MKAVLKAGSVLVGANVLALALLFVAVRVGLIRYTETYFANIVNSTMLFTALVVLYQIKHRLDKLNEKK